MRLLQNILAGIQYLLPHHLLSSLVHWFMRIRIKPVKNLQISLISEVTGVDWSESKLKSPSDFENFNAFFTRELAAGARPVDPDPSSFVAPSDGKISQCGRLTNDRILQAKGQHYALRETNEEGSGSIGLAPGASSRVKKALKFSKSDTFFSFDSLQSTPTASLIKAICTFFMVLTRIRMNQCTMLDSRWCGSRYWIPARMFSKKPTKFNLQ